MPTAYRTPWPGERLAGEAPPPPGNAGAVVRLLSRCPAHGPTPRREMPALAARLGVARLHLKDERTRTGLGGFAALGSAHAIAREAAAPVAGQRWHEALAGRLYATASAGNRGLSVAAGGRPLGAPAAVRAGATDGPSMEAATVATHARAVSCTAPRIVVVEPEAAPALTPGIRAGRVVTAPGPISTLGRIDRKAASMIARAGLARDADAFVTISEEDAARVVGALGAEGIGTSRSGAAGLAVPPAGRAPGRDARVPAIVTLGPADG